MFNGGQDTSKQRRHRIATTMRRFTLVDFPFFAAMVPVAAALAALTQRLALLSLIQQRNDGKTGGKQTKLGEKGSWVFPLSSRNIG